MCVAFRLEFEQNPDAFLEKVKPDQEALTAKLVEARKRLNKCVGLDSLPVTQTLTSGHCGQSCTPAAS